jgi:hypothetical protein
MATTQKQTQEQRLANLHALGFDQSEGFGGRWGLNSIAVRCSQCAALVINGHPSHETGCQNAMTECNGCNALVPSRQRYCEDCQ